MEEKLKAYEILYHEIKNIKIKGLGSKTLEKLRGYGIKRLIDIFYYFPRTYQDKSNLKKISEIAQDEYVVLKGEVLKAEIVRTRKRLSMFKALFTDGSGMIELVWFKMPYLKNTIKAGQELIVFGNVKKRYSVQLVNPEYRFVKEGYSEELKIEPIYTLPQSLNQNKYLKIVKQVFEFYSDSLYEIIPENILKKYKIPNRIEAIEAIHFPKDIKKIGIAKRRVALEELFVLELGILAKRYELDMKNYHRYSLEDKKDLVKSFLNDLKFELTKAQKRVVADIYGDLNNGKIVNRLIQGDVGSGKTVVAMIMLLYMVENGYQGVMMAPTEILAEQHFLGSVDIFYNLGIKTEILTGSIKGKKRERILSELEQGEIKIVIGTHALIEDNVKFKKLGLIVIDEQHKFGVEQRKKLREKGIISNLMVMTATPIPRSLALSIYGDLDVSVIDELPPNRKYIKTKWIKSEEDHKKTYDFIKKKLNEGRQCYVVCPLIEKSENSKWNSVETVADELKNNYFNECSIGILHGKMKSEEKDKIMHQFKKKKLDILISTTVVEVGVDVPNASIMLIMDSDRFGLSQLHQLRGRVGRGEHQSYCFLSSQSDNEVSIQRMKIMEKTNDGFIIAEEDLKLRKPGEVFGKRQSGISDIKFVDVIRDIKLIKTARDEVIEYLKINNGKVENEILKKEISEKFEEL
jgi:ATP-dependent DNA helicase RecG